MALLVIETESTRWEIAADDAGLIAIFRDVKDAFDHGLGIWVSGSSADDGPVVTWVPATALVQLHFDGELPQEVGNAISKLHGRVT